MDPVSNRIPLLVRIRPGAQAGQIYAYVHGPSDPPGDCDVDPEKLLLTYGRGVVVPKNCGSRGAARQKVTRSHGHEERVVDPHTYDWEGDTPLAKPSSRTVVYEMHAAVSPDTPVPASQRTCVARMRA
jgi:glycogen operon protein